MALRAGARGPASLAAVLAPAEHVPEEDLSAIGRDFADGSSLHILLLCLVFALVPILLFGYCWLFALDAKGWMGRMQNSIRPSNGMQAILLKRINILLIFIPLGWTAHWCHWQDTVTFLLNIIAVLPLASIMGVATEEIACHTGQLIGGLLNATFGNAVELIVVVQSLREGLLIVTKGTLLGSILANELLVLGMALFFGGLFERDNIGKLASNKQQSFSQGAAMVQAQLLIFAAIIFCMPSMFTKAYMIRPEHVLAFSRAGSVCSLVGYAVFLIFQLFTHREMLAGTEVEEEEAEEASISVSAGVALLVGATLTVAVTSEFMVHAIQGFTDECGFSQTFVGVVLLPIIGNACEHSTAVVVALKDKVTLSISIALGSTIQIALFVTPFAVICGWILDKPMDLNFHRVNSWGLLLSALLVITVLTTGKSNWLNGFVLIITYLVLAGMYFLSPDDALA
mmetsp:Transcript_5865/g.17352  ORF Transcript_5865/g.17352 Transcript_5865/m.17352 type:complete len:455 (-) Transcript_5865:86-1450(-)